MSRVVELYGMTVESDLMLNGATEVEGLHARIELRIRRQPPRDIPVAIPDGEILALWGTPEGFAHVVVRGASGVTFRIPRLAEFFITERDGAFVVDCFPAALEHVGLMEVLASGALFAVLLELNGEPVLHASAVAVNERAVAVVGHSGRGKTTTSALLCRNGFPLVTDDLLRLRLTDDEVHCFRGSTSLRLREATRPWIEATGLRYEISPDHRLLLNAPAFTGTSLPLAALVFPVPMKDGSAEIAARRLRAPEAMDELLASPRFYGWEEAQVLTDLFRLSTTLARRLPAFEVKIPWTLDFDDAVVRDLGRTIEEIAQGPDVSKPSES